VHAIAVWLPIVVLAVGFEAFCATELVRRPAKVLPKLVWALILLEIPWGGICYLIFGRAEQPSPERSSPEQPSLAPHVPPGAPARPPFPSVPRPGPAPVTASAALPPAEREGRPALRTRALTRVYQDGVGLHQVDLSVPGRGVYGLVGPNGAGKTTLLSLLAGLRRPDSGTVEPGSGDTRVMLCPDAPAFEPWLTAAETVTFFAGLGGVRRDDADRALTRVGLAGARDRRVGGFSRGMTQRLGLAVALASDARVLLLDEPTSALDPQGRSDVLDLIRELGRDRAVVFSSHILADVQRVADTVGVLRQGRLIHQGPIGDLLALNLRPSWSVHLRSGAAALADRLRGRDWVASVDVREQALRVDTTSLHAGETLLPAEITASGAELITFNPVGADLEAVFFSLLDARTQAGATQ
jgi:ABC-2 type transport system ATP-binding protein